MKKFKKVALKTIISFFLIYIFFSSFSFATEQIVKEQADILNISEFVKEGKTYTKEAFPDLDISELLSSAISGKIDNDEIFSRNFHTIW